jgi:hypothetical protein
MYARYNSALSAPNTPRISTYRPARAQRFCNQHFQHHTELLILHVLISIRINTYENSQNPPIPLIPINLNSTKINTSGDKDLKSPRINTSGNKNLKSNHFNTSKKQGRGVGASSIQTGRIPGSAAIAAARASRCPTDPGLAARCAALPPTIRAALDLRCDTRESSGRACRYERGSAEKSRRPRCAPCSASRPSAPNRQSLRRGRAPAARSSSGVRVDLSHWVVLLPLAPVWAEPIASNVCAERIANIGTGDGTPLPRVRRGARIVQQYEAPKPLGANSGGRVG